MAIALESMDAASLDEAVTALESNTGLTTLDLKFNLIGDQGAERAQLLWNITIP